MRSDLAAAVECCKIPVGIVVGKAARAKLVEEVASRLTPDEKVLAAGYGMKRGAVSNNWVLVVVTSDRVMAVRRSLTAGGSESIPIASLTGVSTGRSARTSAVKFTGAGTNDEIAGMAHSDAERVANVARRLLAGRQSPGPAQGSSLSRRLRSLQTAKDDGLISEAEFATARLKLIDGG